MADLVVRRHHLVAKAPSRLVDRASRAVPGMLALAAGLWVLTVHQTQFSQMGDLGLASILPKTYYLGLAVLAGCYGVELLRTRLRTRTLLTATVLLVVYLFGTACAVEPTGALTSSWVHAGYVQYLLEHGHSLDNFAAEFSWPGGFSLGATLTAFAGQLDALGMLRWFPLAYELLCLLPLLAIARAADVSRRAGWLAIGLFYSANWIYQDYFSPQAFAYLLFLSTLATVLTIWRPRPLVTPSRRGIALRRRWLQTREALRMRRLTGADAETDWDPSTILGTLAILALMGLAISMGHQLTPYALTAALLACLFTRRLARPELPILIAVFAIGWLSLGASNYWVGHLDVIFGSVGRLGSLLNSNVSNRVTGSISHQRVVEARILMTMALFGLAAIGSLRRAAASRTLEALGAIPFFLLFFQNYGGEGLLRVVLFALPFASLLAASAILPSRSGQTRPWLPVLRLRRLGPAFLALVAAGALFCCAVGTTLVRGGNDAYQTFGTGEVAAVDWAYAHVQAGQRIGIVVAFAPIGQRDVGDVRIFSAASVSSGVLQTPGTIVKLFATQRPDVIVLSKAQEQWGVIVAGFAPGWQTRVERSVLHNGYVVAARFPDAVVLKNVRAAR